MHDKPPTYINRKSRQTGIRWLHHIYEWLSRKADTNPSNQDSEISKEIKQIVHERFEQETGCDYKTGLPKQP